MKFIRLICATAFAAVALSAIAGASPAAASYLTLGQYPGAYEGNSQGALTMNLSGRAMECEGLDFVSVGSASGPAQQVQTATSTESNCSWIGGPAKLNLQSCDFILHPGNPGGSIEIGPAGCGGATLTTGECSWSIPAQQGIATNYYNQSTKPASVSMQTSGSFTYSVVSGGSFMCGKGTLTGSLYAQWTVSGVSGGGSAVSAAVTDHPPVGIFLTGNQLAAESYPVSLNGVQSASAKRIFTFAGRDFYCSEVSLTGEATSASSSFVVSPSYSGCSAVVLGNLLPATIDASGCTETYTVTASKAPYTASLDLTCSSPMKFTVTQEGTTVCTYTVASKSGLGSVNLANTGEGLTRGVDIGWQLGSLPYTRASGKLAACGGAAGTATATGTVQLHGSI